MAKVHLAKPDPKPGQEHWTVCGLFRGFYTWTSDRAEVSCAHCVKWIAAHAR